MNELDKVEVVLGLECALVSGVKYWSADEVAAGAAVVDCISKK